MELPAQLLESLAEIELKALFNRLRFHFAMVRFIYIKRRVWKSESNMNTALADNIKSFIEQSALANIDHILNQLTCENEEEQLLTNYLATTSFRENESARMYLFLMLCHFFKGKISLNSDRWNVYLESNGFQRTVEDHLNFKVSPEDFVDECFKLWTISPNNSSKSAHPCKT